MLDYIVRPFSSDNPAPSPPSPFNVEGDHFLPPPRDAPFLGAPPLPNPFDSVTSQTFGLTQTRVLLLEGIFLIRPSPFPTKISLRGDIDSLLMTNLSKVAPLFLSPFCPYE